MTRFRRPARRALIAMAAVAASAAAMVPAVRADAADESVTVNFSVAGAAPVYHASGTLYGMTENAANPPDHFYTDIKWHFERAGGAQLPGGGWVGGGYTRRWNSVLAQARRTAALGGTFVVLPHDLWGADGTQQPSFPGDNGDWTTFDNFLNQLISDVRANNLTVQWDIWNEPDLGIFWNRSQDQYLAMWARAYRRIRQTFPAAVIVGPSTADKPRSDNGWWTTFLDYAKANNVLPDIYSWHDEPGDPVPETQSADALLSARGINRTRPYQINEYGTFDQQNPGGAGWFIGRFERAGADGLRGNWASGQGLHDDAANLLVNNGSTYSPRGEWFLYQYYGSQTGSVVATTPSSSLEAFATKDTGIAKVLLGNAGTTGNMRVNLTHLDTTSVVTGGQVRVTLQRVPHNGGGAVGGPVTVSDTNANVSGNSIAVTVPWSNAQDGYTITLRQPSTGGGGGSVFTSTAVAQHSGLCLDDPNASTTAGTQLQQQQCGLGARQNFTFTPVTGSANTYTIVNQASGMCVDVSGRGTADGTAIIQWSCNGQTNQQFTLQPVTVLGNAKDFQLAGVQSGKCVDVSTISTAPGAPIHLWTCDPPDALPNKQNQIWRLTGKTS